MAHPALGGLHRFHEELAAQGAVVSELWHSITADAADIAAGAAHAAAMGEDPTAVAAAASRRVVGLHSHAMSVLFERLFKTCTDSFDAAVTACDGAAPALGRYEWHPRRLVGAASRRALSAGGHPAGVDAGPSGEFFTVAPAAMRDLTTGAPDLSALVPLLLAGGWVRLGEVGAPTAGDTLASVFATQYVVDAAQAARLGTKTLHGGCHVRRLPWFRRVLSVLQGKDGLRSASRESLSPRRAARARSEPLDMDALLEWEGEEHAASAPPALGPRDPLPLGPPRKMARPDSATLSDLGGSTAPSYRVIGDDVAVMAAARARAAEAEAEDLVLSLPSQEVQYRHDPQPQAPGPSRRRRAHLASSTDLAAVALPPPESAVPRGAAVFQLTISVKPKRAAIVEAVQQLGAAVITDAKYAPHATHLIAEPGTVERTEKYLAFRASGKPIVTPDFVLQSAATATPGTLLNEARFAAVPAGEMPPLRRPFAAWTVALFASSRIVAGLTTILAAGGCAPDALYVAPFHEKAQFEADAAAQRWAASLPLDRVTHAIVEVDLSHGERPVASAFVPPRVQALPQASDPGPVEGCRIHSLELLFQVLCTRSEALDPVHPVVFPWDAPPA